MTRRLVLVLLGTLAVLGVAPPALAATHTVTLSPGNGTVNVTISSGDTVTFRAGDGNTYQLTSGKGWSFSATVTTAKPATTKPFETPGTYTFSSTFGPIAAPATSGSIVLPAMPSPPASASPGPSVTTSAPSASAKPSASASASAVPSASGSGVAIPPPITTGVVPTAAPTDSAGPQPQVATSVAGRSSAAPSAGPVSDVGYGDPGGLVQSSPHGFGLPAALAVVAVVGVTTLLVRFLLATPEAQRPVR